MTISQVAFKKKDFVGRAYFFFYFYYVRRDELKLRHQP